jgi:hypothetical protein
VLLGSIALVVLASLLAGACTDEASSDPPAAAPSSLGAYPPPPVVPEGGLDPAVADALGRLAPSLAAGELDRSALETVAATEDARLAWFLADMLRFMGSGSDVDAVLEGFERLTGVDPLANDDGLGPWNAVTDHLIAWDLPAAPGYRELKGDLFLLVEPGWEPFFADADGAIDWRIVSWGGVLIDDRSAGSSDPCPRGCIPALDDPALTEATEGDWYPDDAIVFGVVVGDEAVAFPKHIMEVHEMVNITIGGRRLGIPYCTLCGSAQAYLTDTETDGLGVAVLRTSGLLSRSNKVMYDLNTSSVFDTFTGHALSGPMQDAGVVLEQTTVVTSTWGAWKQAHPDTRIVAEDGGIGRSYPADPLGGRDDDGPIFPVGPVDPRLPVQAQVVGVIGPDGTPVAFPVDRARRALSDGETVEVDGVRLVLDGDGFRVESPDGRSLPAHQAFWFAWSQFHPDTLVWAAS